MDTLIIERAKMDDADAVYKLYHSLIQAPYSTWSEEYPTREDVCNDVAHGFTMVMRDGHGGIAAAIALLPAEEEPEFENLASWYPDIRRWAIPSRLGVALAYQGRGIAGKMLCAAMQRAREDGCDAVRFLVAKHNPIAQRAYAKLGFDICGEAEMWGEQWLCYQKRLAP